MVKEEHAAKEMTFMLRPLTRLAKRCAVEATITEKIITRIGPVARLHVSPGKCRCLVRVYCGDLATYLGDLVAGFLHGEYEFQDPKSEEEV